MTKKEFKKKFKKVAAITISVLLTIASMVSLGFLSFVGLFLLFPSVALSFLSMILASIVEFTVFFENISNAFKKLLQKSYLKTVLATKYLYKLAKSNIQKSWFIQDYIKQRQYIDEQSHNKNLNEQARKELEQQKIKLTLMEKSFRYFLFKTGPVSEELRAELSTIVSEEKRRQIIKEDTRKRWLGRAVIIPIIIAAISCGVVTFTAISEGLAQILPLINMSVASFTPCVIALSVFAGIAYAFQIYNTVTDIIYNDSMQKLWRNIVKNVRKGGVKSIIYGIAVMLLIGLGIFVTLATAGTWWSAVKPAIALLTSSKAPATIVNIISILFFGAANLAFNLQNTHETLRSFQSMSIKNTIKRVKEKIKEKFRGENAGQWVNPFRALLFLTRTPFRLAGFGMHVLSIGAISDNFGNKWVAFAASSITETFEDWHYIMGEEEHGHHHDKKEGHKHSHGHNDKKPKQDHAHTHAHHGHNHVDIFGAVFVVITFIPLYLPAIIWDWAFSRLNKDESKKLTFVDAWHKTFGTKPKNLCKRKFELSRNWKNEQDYVIQNKKSRLFAPDPKPVSMVAKDKPSKVYTRLDDIVTPTVSNFSIDIPAL